METSPFGGDDDLAPPAPDARAGSRARVLRRVLGALCATAVAGLLIYGCAGGPHVDYLPVRGPVPQRQGNRPGRPALLSGRSPVGPPPQGLLAAAFAPDGRTAAFGGASGVVRLYDTASGTAKGRFDARIGADRVVAALAFGPDGRTVAVGLGRGAVEIRDLARHATRRLGDLGQVPGALRFGAGGRTVTAIGTGGVIRVWSLGAGRPVAPYSVDGCAASALSRDGTIAACGVLNDGVTIWSVARGTVIARLAEPLVRDRGLAFSPDGRTLAVDAARAGRDRVGLWDVASRRRAADLGVPASDGGAALTFSPDGTVLAVSVHDRGRYAVELRRVPGGTLITTLAGGPGQVGAVAFGPGGDLLAVARRGGGELWNARTRVRLASLAR